IRIVDVGTGSGAIAVALAVRLRSRRMLSEVDLLAVDDAADALDLAKENAVGHAVADQMRFAEADLIPNWELPFDLVLANLPYIATEDLATLPAPVQFEPRHALDGGPDGLDVIRRLVAILPEVLVERGVALLEIGSDQGSRIVELADALPGHWSCTVEPDLAGLPRVARIERTEP
ncbi:MAG: HemK family protein methyltransferase, partial [Chloroflexota bacterium]